MLNCKALYTENKEQIKQQTDKLRTKGKTVGLGIIQVGDDPASSTYVKGKLSDCVDVGITTCYYRLSPTVTNDELKSLISRLNKDNNVDGIIVQLPLPSHINVSDIQQCVVRRKDVDGFRDDSPYTPCTIRGIKTILDKFNVHLDGLTCLVIGRGSVGVDAVKMLLHENATVIWCNSHTSEEHLHQLIADAQVVISAAGHPCLIKNVPDGCVVVDVGITRGNDGKLYGDVDKKIYSDTAFITPVPNGVGLMTRVSLLQNVVEAAYASEVKYGSVESARVCD